MGVVYPDSTGCWPGGSETACVPLYSRCIACCFCGYRPNSPSSCSALISALLLDDTSGHYADLFQTLGIFEDVHLRILLGMNKEDRDTFFAAYVPRRISPFGFIEITQILQHFADSHRWACLSLTPIPRKGEAFEEFLSRPETCPKLTAHSMRLSMGEYEVLTARIALRIPWFLDIHSSFGEQMPQVQALVQAVRDAYPLFDRYKDAWPISVFIKRILATAEKSNPVYSVHPQPPDYSFAQSQQSQRSCYVDAEPLTLVNQQHKCPRLSQYLSCEVPQRISPAAKSLLSFLQMDEEIAPALFFLGVYDDTKFDAVKRMKPERKAQLIEEANELELSAMQRLVLYMIFE
ncbi:hypothetical protein DFH09DRAFT_1275887 [Mycena vulgaris]|nr:hypothetical protein DFH09DRAFT_1275887 [Mycena vulgaris]